MPLLRSAKCNECDHEFDFLSWQKDGVTIQVEVLDGEGNGCANCGSTNWTNLLGLGTGIDLGDVGGVGKTYPYYDRALRCYIQSKKHRDQVCKAKGVVPIDGDFDNFGQFKNQFKEEDESLKRHKKYLERLEHDPEFADYRRLRDKGYFEDQKKLEMRRMENG